MGSGSTGRKKKPCDDDVFNIFQTKNWHKSLAKIYEQRASDFSAWFSNISGVPICLFWRSNECRVFCAGVSGSFSHKSSHLIAIISSSQKLAITKNSHRKILTFSYGRQSNFENVCLSKTNGVSNNMEVQQVLGGMFIGLLVCLCAPRYGA